MADRLHCGLCGPDVECAGHPFLNFYLRQIGEAASRRAFEDADASDPPFDRADQEDEEADRDHQDRGHDD